LGGGLFFLFNFFPVSVQELSPYYNKQPRAKIFFFFPWLDSFVRLDFIFFCRSVLRVCARFNSFSLFCSNCLILMAFSSLFLFIFFFCVFCRVFYVFIVSSCVNRRSPFFFWFFSCFFFPDFNSVRGVLFFGFPHSLHWHIMTSWYGLFLIWVDLTTFGFYFIPVSSRLFFFCFAVNFFPGFVSLFFLYENCPPFLFWFCVLTPSYHCFPSHFFCHLVSLFGSF